MGREQTAGRARSSCRLRNTSASTDSAVRNAAQDVFDLATAKFGVDRSYWGDSAERPVGNNATVKYTAFAIQAEVEGYMRVAALFRATARAEQVHAAHHARVITKMGGTPTAHIHAPEVKSTRENLLAAKNGEEYERDVMYVKFIAEATDRGQKEAVHSFTVAKKAEAVHAQLYAEALNRLEAQQMTTTFYVCLVCGEVSDRPEDTERCPICGAAKDKFIAVR